MKRCMHCNGVLFSEPVDGWEYHRTLSGDIKTSEPLRGSEQLEWRCMLCGRSEHAGPAETEQVLPPPRPLTGVCPNGHDRTRWGWYSRDERTLSGYARRCVKCGKANAAASRLRNNGRGNRWNAGVAT